MQAARTAPCPPHARMGRRSAPGSLRVDDILVPVAVAALGGSGGGMERGRIPSVSSSLVRPPAADPAGVRVRGALLRERVVRRQELRDAERRGGR